MHTTQHARRGLLAHKARPLRFILTGSIAALIQLGLLDTLTHLGWKATLANIIAFLLAAQVNFALSYVFTWHDRHPLRRAKKILLKRWIAFHIGISGTALLNMLVFIIAVRVPPALLASALGIGVAALINFVINDRLIFRMHQVGVTLPKTPDHL
jgi:putative flippase GtrA